MKNANNTVTVGLIKGRHEMPVNDYIFENAIKDVHNYDTIRNHIMTFIETEVGIYTTTYYQAINQIDYAETEILIGKRNLVVYVTGLTCVTAELIKCCALNGIHLTLMNFDSVNNGYKAQHIF